MSNGRLLPRNVELGWLGEKGSQIMRMFIVTLSAALMLLAPQAGAAKSQLKCGGDNLQSEER